MTDFATFDMQPFIPHFLCTHFWQLLHCIELLPTPLLDPTWQSYSLLPHLLTFSTYHNLGFIHGVKTLRTQDTSDLRHFGIGAEMSVRHFGTEVSLVWYARSFVVI